MANNQENILKRVITVEKGMQEMFSLLQNVAGMMSASKTSPSNSAEDDSIVFNQIDDENSLMEFEKTVEDVNVRKKIINHFVRSIGKSINAPARSVALQVEQQMFTQSFWSKTAWTGGRNSSSDGSKKFAFSTHIVSIAFITDLIAEICGTQMTNSAFAEFIKSRSRNSGYIRTTNRQVSARIPRTQRKRKITNAVNENGDENTHVNSEQNASSSTVTLPVQAMSNRTQQSTHDDTSSSSQQQ